MHQTKKGHQWHFKKGHQWHFGMKARIGADAGSGLVHSLSTTAANVADVAQAHALLHGEEKDIHADAGYQGADKRPEVAARAPQARWHIAVRRGKIKALAAGALKDLL